MRPANRTTAPRRDVTAPATVAGQPGSATPTELRTPPATKQARSGFLLALLRALSVGHA